MVLKSPWGIAGIILVVVGCLAWFSVTAGKRLRNWLHEPVEPNKPRWTYALTPLAAALAPLAAFSALLPSYFNQQRSDRKFMAETQRSRTDAEWHQIRLDTEMQASQFTEAQTRLGSPDAKTRAVAALQLADLALLPKPTAGGGAFDAENYSRFASTGAQMALALQMEQNPDVRAALGQATQKLTAFAGEKKNMAWQYALANQLADANRRVKQSFTQTLARYAAANEVTKPPTLRVLSTVAPFAARPETTMVVLKGVMATDRFRADKRIGIRLRDAQTFAQRRAADASLLAAVQLRATHLVDSRDALADALRALKPASEPAPTLPAAATKQSKRTLQLADCFLCGADLRGAFLNNADVTGADVNGALLAGADLTMANVEAALHLPPSVTQADFGANSERVQALKKKYRDYHWAEAERRVSEARKKAGASAAKEAGGAGKPSD